MGSMTDRTGQHRRLRIYQQWQGNEVREEGACPVRPRGPARPLVALNRLPPQGAPCAP
jgi:hypothetical protein